MNTKPSLEVFNVKCKNDTYITVKVSYKERTVSLVNDDIGYSNKNWIFVNRTLSYMNGWRAILDDMKEAIAIGEQKLEAYIEEEQKKINDVMFSIAEEQSIIEKALSKKKLGSIKK